MISADINETLGDEKFSLASSRAWAMTPDRPTLETYLKENSATQGSLRNIWAHFWDDKGDTCHPCPGKDALTNQIYNANLQTVIQPPGMGALGGLYPQPHIKIQDLNFTDTTSWTVIISCPAEGNLSVSYTMIPDIPSVEEAARVFDWITTVNTVRNNISVTQFFPTFHDDTPTHNTLWLIVESFNQLEDRSREEDSGGTHNTFPNYLFQSWKETCGNPIPPFFEKIELLQDGWIRKCTPNEHAEPYYEFILPATGLEVVVNGA